MAVVGADADDDGADVGEQSRLDTPTFAFGSNADLSGVLANSTLTSISSIAATGTRRRARVWSTGGKSSSSPLAVRLQLQPSTGELRTGAGSNSESTGSGSRNCSGYGGRRSESTDDGSNDNGGGAPGIAPKLKKKPSLGKTKPRHSNCSVLIFSSQHF